MSIEIDHIGIAVNSLDHRTPFWVALGLIMGEDEELPNDRVIARFFSTSGESDVPPRIELLQATSPESPIGRFIEKRGEGIQQIAFRVENIEHTISILLENGVQMIDDIPRIGAHGSMIAFVHPKSTGGVLVEIVQRT
ncbi:MAG: methylmalonyl-CoA epimerase [Candidatus Thalassarchaeaceae archaeon]|nr:MAG: methylmalonyl-CoA epimerase [Euryarchaeota archaeon]RPG74133.1 MAG: methylmalonyl-CoA epimerase [Euryarchaeota archaeon TMED85]|tara:strand:- start:5016 stop:5429 length:414 start_codon:yes stop_codon:yes gene_type:complete